MTEAIEITTFKLVKGCSTEAFVAANTDIDTWLKRQASFRSRRIARQEDGTVVDMLLWNSTAEAENAMNRLMDELPDSPHPRDDRPAHSVLDRVARRASHFLAARPLMNSAGR